MGDDGCSTTPFLGVATDRVKMPLTTAVPFSGSANCDRRSTYQRQMLPSLEGHGMGRSREPVQILWGALAALVVVVIPVLILLFFLGRNLASCEGFGPP